MVFDSVDPMTNELLDLFVWCCGLEKCLVNLEAHIDALFLIRSFSEMLKPDNNVSRISFWELIPRNLRAVLWILMARQKDSSGSIFSRTALDLIVGNLIIT